jgi:diketogulonate reductase-like aldo/keto reductase
VIIAYSPLAQGLLSGRYDQANRPTDGVRASSPRFHPENLERTSKLIAVLREVADAHSATPAQIALAWVIHRPAVAAIPGASSVEQLESNVAAAEIQLSDDEYQALQTVSDRFCPTAAPSAPPHHNLSELKSSAKFALKHSAKGGWYVAKTVWHDYQLKYISRSDIGHE